MTTSILGKLGKAAANMRSGFLSVAGLGCITYAGFTVSPIAGWITAGASLLLIDFAREKSAPEAARR